MSKLKHISKQSYLTAVTSFFIAGSVLQNILAVKSFGTETTAITTGGTLISWAVFASMDIVTEAWGKKRAVTTFTVSAIFNLAFNLICWIAILLPGTSDFIAEAYKTVLGTGWRIAVASVLAFWLGNYVNAAIMHTMRRRSKNEESRIGFEARAVTSTLLGQIVDNSLFYIIAFSPLGISGTVENSWITIIQLVCFTTIIETVVEGVVSPVTARFVGKIKKADDEKAPEPTI
ncbi:MAG: queuosine precursor transporter [Firmicutes bacterium]|nr:queuosine precursor transporter [Bacillota bacterium]